MKTKRIIANILLFLTGAIGFATLWTIRHFYNVSFDQIIFHLQTSVSGVDSATVFSALKYFIVFILLYLICFFIINGIIKKKNVKKLSNIYFLTALLLFLGCGYYSFKLLSIDVFFEDIVGKDSSFIQDNYINPKDLKVSFPKNKKNLILLYLESMESSYASKKDGGLYDKNYIPNLTKIAQNNISFSNDNDLGGAKVVNGVTWTTGGVVAINSGIPIKIEINEKKSVNNYHFSFKNAYSMGDLLYDNGYIQELMLGSSIHFGGLYDYYNAHHMNIIWDTESASKEGFDTSNAWGIDDVQLFNRAKKELTNLSNNNEPFAFSLMTIDTHSPDGYVYGSCKSEYNNKYSNALKCSDKHINEFISWIKKQDFYDNTVIVLVGDHLSMNTSLSSKVSFQERTIYNSIINSDKKYVNNKNRTFTNMDYFPTILSAMDVEIPGNQLGLGIDLFSNSPTLPEKYSFNDYYNELNKKSLFYRKLY